VDLRRLIKQIEIQTEKERTGSQLKTVSDARTQRSIGAGLSRKRKLLFVVAVSLFLLTAIAGYRFLTGRSSNQQIESLAVLPFQNASGDADVEYLSDGMAESLINSLSQLPNLSVKARSSVFRFKGREHEPQRVAEELSVEAILNGRIVLHGEDLALYLALIDGKTGNQLWGEQYNRKMTDILALQSEIARDVSQKLRARLSGEEAKQLSKNYTENVEAYQLYLKGRYHIFKLRPKDIQTGIVSFQKAIEIDPAYPLAYVGLANAYRGLSLSVDLPPNEFFPKGKSAALKAIEIDESLAEAHSALGSLMFWYDWDWKGAENQFQRALELNPNDTDTHFGYAHLLSNSGRHEEALTRMKRATELDPLSPLVSTAAGLCLLQAGRTDDALSQFQKTLELDPNFWLARMFVSSAYIDKGMLAEAIAEARKAKELSGISTNPDAFLGYALAKSGKRAEAQALLDGLLKLSEQRYIPPYHIAMIYYGLEDREEALRWLERGVEQRDPKMVFLSVERKWNPLRPDRRFQALLHRVGFTP
jgi:TolB-like protein/Flp pilus assembly protein TadD